MILGSPATIKVRNLENNIGLIPFKIGRTKITEFTHSIIYYNDLNPLIIEINKLKIKSGNLTEFVTKNINYWNDTSNYLKILKFTEEKVEDKLIEILPHPKRVKRGLINGLGSIFKSITGNLDATDGERYENLIKELQGNQEKLAKNIRIQNTLAVSLIDKFNNTFQQIKHNENLLETKLEQISKIVEGQAYRENSMFIKDVMIQLINMYEIIISILQDVENSISFAKLGTMHPSIIKITDLVKLLKSIEMDFKTERVPIEVNLENTILFEKFIKIDSYILSNKITYIIQIPITYPFDFELYHLYSIPIPTKGQFKAIVPQNKYLAKSKLYYTFTNDPCTKILPQQYICERMDLHEITNTNPCEVQLLDIKNTSTCHHIQIKVTQPMFRRLGESDQWIALLTTKETIKLKCHQQEEVMELVGTFLFEIPTSCQIITNQQTIINKNSYQVQANPYILFPDVDTSRRSPLETSISLHLENFELDELQDLKMKIIQNQPDLSWTSVFHLPSIWTIFIYGLLVSITTYAISKILLHRRCNKPADNQNQPDTHCQDVQLPR